MLDKHLWTIRMVGDTQTYELHTKNFICTILPLANWPQLEGAYNKGNYVANVFYIGKEGVLDKGNGFPRYFFELDTAETEMILWLRANGELPFQG